MERLGVKFNDLGMRSMINIQFENQPVVGVYKVEPLWHLYLARPGNVQCCSARIDRVAHIDRINLHLEEGHGGLLLADILD